MYIVVDLIFAQYFSEFFASFYAKNNSPTSTVTFFVPRNINLLK